MADLRLAAWLAWMTPLLTALSRCRPAARASSCAFAESPDSAASRKRRTAVLSVDFTDLLRSRAASFWRLRLIWDLMFATEQCLDRKLCGHVRERAACRRNPPTYTREETDYQRATAPTKTSGESPACV